MAELVKIATESDHDSEVSLNFNQWENTIGSSRQVLLFEAKHIDWFANFCNQLKLTEADIWLVKPSEKPNSLTQAIGRAGLEKFLHSKREVSVSFQLDVARFGEPELVAPSRFAAVIRESGRLNSSFELLLLWVTWIFSMSWDGESQPPNA